MNTLRHAVRPAEAHKAVVASAAAHAIRATPVKAVSAAKIAQPTAQVSNAGAGQGMA